MPDSPPLDSRRASRLPTGLGRALRRVLPRTLAALVLLSAVLASVSGAIGVMVTLQPGLQERFVSRPATPSRTAHPAATPTPLPTTPALPAGNDWSEYRFDATGAGYNPETSLTTANVGAITPRWQVKTGVAFESTPAIVDGVVYVTNGNSLFAYDLQTAHLLWRFDAAPQQIATVSSSVAIDSALHRAFYGNPDGRVYAVDTRTGAEAWTVLLSDEPGAFVWGSPLIANGKIYIGVASRDDNPCVRGAIFAIDEQTGVTLWKHYTVPDGALGGTVWSSIAANPALHEVIATTGNPCPDGGVSGEEDSILGLDWDTGVVRWQYQALSYDDCDCDFGQGPIDVVYQGREYVVAGNKYGAVYALSRDPSGGSPALVWRQRIASWGFIGQGGIFEPPSYQNGLVYVAGGPSLDGACRSGELFAFHIDTGSVAWQTCTAGQVVSPAAVAGGVLLVPQQDAMIAYDAATGRQLRSFAEPGAHWGGVSIAHGFLVDGAVAGVLYCYFLPT